MLQQVIGIKQVRHDFGGAVLAAGVKPFGVGGDPVFKTLVTNWWREETFIGATSTEESGVEGFPQTCAKWANFMAFPRIIPPVARVIAAVREF